MFCWIVFFLFGFSVLLTTEGSYINLLLSLKQINKSLIYCILYEAVI